MCLSPRGPSSGMTRGLSLQLSDAAVAEVGPFFLFDNRKVNYEPRISPRPPPESISCISKGGTLELSGLLGWEGVGAGQDWPSASPGWILSLL